MRSQRTSGFHNRRPGAVLIVEDDGGVGRAIKRFVPEEHEAVLVQSVAEARGALATNLRLAAAVVDIGLPDGSGVEVVELLRQRSQHLPVLVLTALVNGRLINEVNALGAQYVCKPDFSRNLVAFFRTLATDSRDTGLLVERAAQELSLTNREREILVHSMSGVPRGRIAEVLGISENTLKKYVRSLLKKTRQSSLSEAVWHVRMMASEPGEEVG